MLLTLFAALMLAAAAAMLRRPRRPAGQPGPAAAAAACGSLLPKTGPDRMTVSASAGAARAVTVDRPAPAASGPRADNAAGKRRSGTRPPGGPSRSPPRLPASLLTGFFGVGGGFVIVPALVLALGFEMPAAVGTSLLVISVNSAAALGARLGEGIHLDWPLTGVFTLAARAGTLAGNRVASRVSADRLTAAFAVLLSAFLDAWPRPSRTSQPKTRTMIKYNKRKARTEIMPQLPHGHQPQLKARAPSFEAVQGMVWPTCPCQKSQKSVSSDFSLANAPCGIR